VPNREPLNIVLVSIDALRADRLSCYGHNRLTTPFLDEIASRGFLFKQAFCHQPGTWISHASLFKGSIRFKLPWKDAIAWKKAFAREGSIYQLDDSDHTLAATFRKAGYSTAGFVSGWNLDRHWGFDSGFDTYQDLRNVSHSRLFRLHWLWSKVTGRSLSWRRTAATNRLVQSWFQKNWSEPFFVFVHYMEPHRPYVSHPNYHDWPMYDQQVRLADEGVQSLWKTIEQAGVSERTILVVLSDHGESLGERNFSSGCHGHNLFEENIRIPCLMYLPGVIPNGAYDGVVRMIDIMPSLLEIAGLEVPSTVQGHSLVPVFQGEDLNLEHYCFIPGAHRYEQVRYRPDVRPEELDVRALIGIRTRDWKFFRFRDGTPIYPELYHLPSDPGETNNLVGLKVEKSRQLEEQLLGIQADIEGVSTDGRSYSPDQAIEQRLKDLGYLD